MSQKLSLLKSFIILVVGILLGAWSSHKVTKLYYEIEKHYSGRHFYFVFKDFSTLTSADVQNKVDALLREYDPSQNNSYFELNAFSRELEMIIREENNKQNKQAIEDSKDTR